MLIHLVAAARPNFMKIAPLYHALKRESWAEPVIVHTGQHYDLNMSDAFFRDLDLPDPHIHLGVGSGSHAEQTARVMIEYEKVLMETRPDLVLVVGDVNSTMACTLAATKVVYPKAVGSQRSAVSNQLPIEGLCSLPGLRPIVAHLEAGLRSFDRTMPEEINRIVTDSLADILWTPSPDADENLKREGVADYKIVRVGNIMIDSLEMLRPRIESEAVYKEFRLEKGKYGVATLHRPSNVDEPAAVRRTLGLLKRTADKIPIIFPVHPRTRKNIEGFGLGSLLESRNGLYCTEPLSYIRFMNLVFNCRLAITDSGGIQEETTYLGVPCLTLRASTERPITITQGTNRLCGVDDLEQKAADILNGPRPEAKRIDLWDGKTADRIVAHLKSLKDRKKELSHTETAGITEERHGLF